MMTPRLRGTRRGIFAILMVAMMLFTSGIAMANPVDEPVRDADGPQAGPIPILSLSLFPSQLQAHVTQSQLGAVTFGGNITVEQMRMMHSTVTLTAVVNTGWPIILSDQTFEMNGPGTEDFQVSVIVPPATSSMITGNVIVTGQCKAPGLAPVVSAASAVVTVAAYLKGRIVSPGSNINLDAGESTNLNVTIYNDGNAAADMRIFASNLPEEVQVAFSESQFHVLPYEFISINVGVTATGGARSGAYPFILVVEADAKDGHGSKEEVAVHNLTVYIPSLKAKLGYSGMVSIIIVCVVVVGVAVFWQMGKLKMPKGLKFPKRSRSESKGTD